VSRSIPDPARTLAAELALRFGPDAQVATRLNDTHRRLRGANERLSSAVHTDGIAAVCGEHPAAVEAALRDNRSQALSARNPLQALQQPHWQIHRAHCPYENVAEDRRDLAARIGETLRAFVDELVGAGWSERDDRNANISELADVEGVGGHDRVPPVADRDGACAQSREPGS
jgi:hypothetical protein